MESNLLKNEINKIKMPSDMKQRILENCLNSGNNNVYELPVKKMSANKRTFRKPLVIAASLVLCFCLVGISVLAATGQLQGFFKDETDWKGAVVGTTYDNADNEILINAEAEAGNIIVNTAFVLSDKPPYSEIDSIRIGNYMITDESGKTVADGSALDTATIENGTAAIYLPSEALNVGTYELTVFSFIGEKKADAPLTINGTWKCEFTI